MPDLKAPERFNELPLALVKNGIVLSSSGFGVVVALAWNQFIQHVVDQYVRPYLGRDGSTASFLIYAVVITLIAILVTMQLTALQRKLEGDKKDTADQKKK